MPFIFIISLGSRCSICISKMSVKERKKLASEQANQNPNKTELIITQIFYANQQKKHCHI